MKKPSDSDMSDIRAFIASVEWRFAKTMAWCPHFYNVLDWNPGKREGFFKEEQSLRLEQTIFMTVNDLVLALHVWK